MTRLDHPSHFVLRRRRRLILGLLAWSMATAAVAQAAPGTRHRPLNVIDVPSFPNIAAWRVTDLSVRVAEGVDARLGAAAIEISGRAEVPGGKVDAPGFEGHLPGCQRLSLWASPTPVGNVAAAGFQVRDADGEWLMQTVPVDWTGWKRIDVDPTAGGMRPAYEQEGQNGKVDLPLTSVHLVWFAKDAGAASLHVDALTAVVEGAASEDRVHVAPVGANVLEPGKPLSLRLLAENPGGAARTVVVKYSLQANPAYLNPPVPEPTLGVDHALGATSTVAVDGVDRGGAKLGDGDAGTGFETPWGSGYREVVATIDLAQPREVRAVHWTAGDANWIFKADVSASLDGSSYAPVDGVQGVDLHAKWAGPHAFPWPRPVTARFLRFRFHKGGETSNVFRLPTTISVYDGIENDEVSIPRVGPPIGSGTAEVTVPPGGFAELSAEGTDPVGPGAYLLGLDMDVAGRREVRWQHAYVLPADAVDQDRARRFGINGSATDVGMARVLQRCGFGWMRFENAKWQMYMPAPDRVGFTGTVAPWNLNFDAIFGTYQEHGLKVLPYVFQPPEWATAAPANVTQNRAGYPPKDPADYGEAVFQLVARYGRVKVAPELLKSDDKRTGLARIDAVELWNEPNLNDPGWGPFVGTMDQYFPVMRAGVEGARRADPSLPVTAGGLAGIDLEVVGQLSEYRYADGRTPLDLVDVVNVHFYSGRDEPETAGWDPNVDRSGPARSGTTYPEQLEELVAWRDRLKPTAEIWMTETGNDVGGPIGRSEWHQAAKVPRGVILALAAGVDKVFIYREAGSTPTMHAGAGLLRNDGSLRPSWLTVATMIRQMQGFNGRGLRLPADDPNVWMLLWEEGDRRMVTAWTLGEVRTLGIDLGPAEVSDGFGRATTVTSTVDVPLGYVPTYIDIGRPSAAFEQLLKGARARAAERAAARQRLAGMPMRLFDFGPAAHVGMLKGYGPPRRFTPVGKDRAWDEREGYGFVTPALGDEDAHWIPGPLERDGCRVAPDNRFRIRLPEGRQALRVRAVGMNAEQPLEVRVEGDGVAEARAVAPEAGVAEFVLDGGKELDVSLTDWGILRWITVIPQ